jgi:hypothetical protein
MSSFGTKSRLPANLGMMREWIAVCDARIKPSPDLTLEVVQTRSPVLVTKAQIVAIQGLKMRDYRADTNGDDPTHGCMFRAVPGVLITTNHKILWAERHTNFQSDQWFRIVSVGERISRQRFTLLTLVFEQRFEHDINSESFPQPKPFRGQEPPY